MAKGNLAACLAVTLKHEGGWSDHPKDPGGATMKGVTLATFRRYYPGATKAELRAISQADVERIYSDGYWRKVAGDALPFGLDLAVFDYGVNSGPSRGVKTLQAEIGAKVDGDAGAETINKAASVDVKRAIQGICARRMSFLRALGTWQTFKRGWSARVADIEVKAVSMWLDRGGKVSETDKRVLREEADKAGKTASVQQKGAGGTATAGGGIGAGDLVATGDANWLLLGGIALAVVAVAGLLTYKARHNRERARAYSEAAA